MYILHSERRDGHIDFTMMCYFIKFKGFNFCISINFYGNKNASISTSRVGSYCKYDLVDTFFEGGKSKVKIFRKNPDYRFYIRIRIGFLKTEIQ